MRCSASRTPLKPWQKETETQITKSLDLRDTSGFIRGVYTHQPLNQHRLNIAIAFLIGLMVFTLLAFLMEFLDNTLKSSEDINNHLGLPVLGVIPEFNKENSLRSHYYGG